MGLFCAAFNRDRGSFKTTSALVTTASNQWSDHRDKSVSRERGEQDSLLGYA